VSGALRRGQRGAAGVRFAIVLVIMAAVLAVVFYGTDAYTHSRVERGVATQLQGKLGTPQPPDVEIEGRPFLTQVAARRLGKVHVVADDVGQTNDAVLAIQHADLTLHDVTTTDWWKTMNVARADGTALVGYDELKRAAGVPITYVGGGRFTVQGSQQVFGVTVNATVTGGLSLDASKQTVSLSNATVQVSGYTLPDTIADQLLKAVVRPIPLEGIPLGLRVTSIAARDDGLHVGLEGADIPVKR
jgi:Flp pilus assembly protein TadG